MGAATTFAWEPWAVALLKAGAAAGKSAAEVALEIGVTRNMAIGKAWRLNVKFHGRRKCGSSWTATEIDQLKAGDACRQSASTIAAVVGRSRNAVRRQAKQLGISLHSHDPQTIERMAASMRRSWAADPTRRAEMSARMRARWADPVYRERQNRLIRGEQA